MIAKIPPRRRDGGSSFRALGDYVLGRTGHSAGAVLHIGMQNVNSVGTAAQEMEALAIENTRSKNPAMHFILSWREMEVPTAQQVDEAVQIALHELDLQSCQALWALQSDTENLHVHVMVNRIDPETYRAIQPAGNWTKKALERAARKIELAQGWEIEQTGRYDVVNGHVVEKEQKAPELTQRARDIEAHTGGQSWERVAKQNVGVLLKNAASWSELHQGLGELGFSLERKGSGAVLVWRGDSGKVNAVKLSTVDRGSSLKKLEARLGAFQERTEGMKQEVSVNAQNGVLLQGTKERYEAEKKVYLTAKRKAIAEIKAIHRETTRKFSAQQRKERSEFWADLKSEGWKGKGQNLNLNRSLFAYFQKTERLRLRERLQEELNEVKARYLQRFPSYKRWLADQRTELFMLYRYPGQNVLMPEQSGVTQPTPRPLDLRDYSARKAGYSVLYCRGNAFTADFKDTGRKIILDRKKLDETSVVAALQLANQKWGATQINGSDEYKELCVMAAVKYGLKLANPDLAAEVERRRGILRNGPVTEAEIAALNLVEKPKKIYANPYTRGYKFSGEVAHVDEARGYCVLKLGSSLYVHRLDRLDVVPKVGVRLDIQYDQSGEHAQTLLREHRRTLGRS